MKLKRKSMTWFNASLAVFAIYVVSSAVDAPLWIRWSIIAVQFTLMFIGWRMQKAEFRDLDRQWQENLHDFNALMAELEQERRKRE